MKTRNANKTAFRKSYITRQEKGRTLCVGHLEGLKTAADALRELRDVTFDCDRDSELLRAIVAVIAAAKFIEGVTQK